MEDWGVYPRVHGRRPKSEGRKELSGGECPFRGQRDLGSWGLEGLQNRKTWLNPSPIDPSNDPNDLRSKHLQTYPLSQSLKNSVPNPKIEEMRIPSQNSHFWGQNITVLRGKSEQIKVLHIFMGSSPCEVTKVEKSWFSPKKEDFWCLKDRRSLKWLWRWKEVFLEEMTLYNI